MEVDSHRCRPSASGWGLFSHVRIGKHSGGQPSTTQWRLRVTFLFALPPATCFHKGQGRRTSLWRCGLHLGTRGGEPVKALALSFSVGAAMTPNTGASRHARRLVQANCKRFRAPPRQPDRPQDRKGGTLKRGGRVQIRGGGLRRSLCRSRQAGPSTASVCSSSSDGGGVCGLRANCCCFLLLAIRSLVRLR